MTLKTGLDKGLRGPSKGGSGDPPKPLKMNIFSIFDQKLIKTPIFLIKQYKNGSKMPFFSQFFKKSWVPPRVLTKMAHFSGDFQYEIAKNFQKSIKIPPGLGVLGVPGDPPLNGPLSIPNPNAITWP